MKLVLFDIDGTLTETIQENISAWKDTFVELFKKRIEMEDSIGRTEHQFLTIALQRANINIKVTEELRQEFFEKFKKNLDKKFTRNPPKLYPGVTELLEKLSNDKNVRLGIITGNLKWVADRILDSAGIHKYFRVMATCNDADERRDLAKIALQMAEKVYKTHFDKVVMIGDTKHDAECARAINAKFIGVTHSSYSYGLTGKNTDYLFHNFRDTEKVLEAILK